jgi:hypothetical protein
MAQTKNLANLAIPAASRPCATNPAKYKDIRSNGEDRQDMPPPIAKNAICGLKRLLTIVFAEGILDKLSFERGVAGLRITAAGIAGFAGAGGHFSRPRHWNPAWSQKDYRNHLDIEK